MADEVIRILVVDDSALYRQLVRNVLRDIPGVDVVGVADSGQGALEQIESLRPDLLTLDVNMPGLNGIDVLRSLKRSRSPARAIMLSGLTAEGAQVTTDALLEGAFDFILKPSGPNAGENRATLSAALSDKIAAFRESRSEGRGTVAPARTPLKRTSAAAFGDGPAAVAKPATTCEVVVIGTSTGGPVALRDVLPLWPGDFPVPVLIVQHMPARYTHSLAQRLNEASQMEVVEACDGMGLEPGFAYIAPGSRQMKVELRGGRRTLRLTDDPPENSCRPSVDYLFRSAAAVFADRAIAIVLTGMGRDGVEGCRSLKQQGAHVIAQHSDGCTVFGMPKAVAEEELADEVLPLERIAGAVLRRVTRQLKART